MTDPSRPPSDQPPRHDVRAGRLPPRRLLCALLALASVIGLLPGVASAHHYEEPGSKGAQIEVTPDGSDSELGGGSPGLLAAQTVTVNGKSFPAKARLDLRQCTPYQCAPIGLVDADATGSFSANVPVSAYPPAQDLLNPTAPLGCASQGPNQCFIQAVQLFTTYVNEPARAEHNICFAPVTGAATACSTTKIVTTTTTTPPPPWEPAAAMNVARTGLAAAAGSDGRIYALGGAGSDGNALASAESLDPCGPTTWSTIAPMLTPRTNFSAAAGPDGRIYAIGGRERVSGRPLGTVEAYDPGTDSWSEVASLAVPRSDLAATTAPDGRIYAIGGAVADDVASTGTGSDLPGVAVSTVEVYDVTADQWTPVTPLPVPKAGLGATVGPNDRVYAIWGGDQLATFGGLRPTPVPTGVVSYAPGPAGTPGVWQKGATPDQYNQGFHLQWNPEVTTGPDGLIYAIGGLYQGSDRAVLTYDSSVDRWTSSPEALTTPRSGHAVAVGRDGRIHAIGGTDDPFPVDDPNPTPAPKPMSSVEAIQVGPNTCPRLTQPADFDGDYETDVSVFRPSSGTWFAKDGDRVAYGAEGDIPVPADYDGDRVTDVAIFRPSVGLWAMHRSSDDTDVFVTYGIGTDVPVPADYDGDGQADIAIFRPEFALWWYRSSSTGLDVPTTFGIATDVPVPADYDGDARADIAVFREGTWFTLPSSGGTYLATAYGNPGDIPVPADYDADRVIDRAVFRPTDGSWSLHRSSDNTDETFSFGNAGDVPVPGDYNGDRISDPAVFRPSSGQWFIETGETHSWGISTDVPLPLPHAIRRAYFGGNP